MPGADLVNVHMEGMRSIESGTGKDATLWALEFYGHSTINSRGPAAILVGWGPYKIVGDPLPPTMAIGPIELPTPHSI